MPSSDPRDRLFYPTLTLMIDSYVKYNNHLSKFKQDDQTRNVTDSQNQTKHKSPYPSATLADPEGGGRVSATPPPQKKKKYIRKNIKFLSKTGPDPLKNHQATNPVFNVGPSSARKLNTI